MSSVGRAQNIRERCETFLIFFTSYGLSSSPVTGEPNLPLMELPVLVRLMGALLLVGTPVSRAQTAAELNARALAKLKEGNLGGAVDDFTAAIAQKPDAGYYASRGDVELTQGNYDGAISDFGEVVKAWPIQIKGYVLRGRVYLLKGDMDSAMKDFSRAIELQPRNAMLRLYRGLVWDCMNNQQGAVEDFSKAVELAGSADETSDYAQLYRGLDLRRKGPAVDMELRDAASWKNEWTRALAAYVSGKLAEADFFRQAATDADDEQGKNHRKAEAFYFAGRVHQLTGDKAGARKDFLASVELQPSVEVERKLARVELDRMGAN